MTDMMIGRTHRVPQIACPSCGKVCDAHAGLDHSELPKAGDLTVCLYCLAVLKFGPGLALTVMPFSEWGALRDASRIVELRATIRAFHAERAL